MKLSEKQRQAVYDAISDPMMDTRIKLRLPGPDLITNAADAKLFHVTQTIFNAVLKALETETKRRVSMPKRDCEGRFLHKEAGDGE